MARGIALVVACVAYRRASAPSHRRGSVRLQEGRLPPGVDRQSHHSHHSDASWPAEPGRAPAAPGFHAGPVRPAGAAPPLPQVVRKEPTPPNLRAAAPPPYQGKTVGQP